MPSFGRRRAIRQVIAVSVIVAAAIVVILLVLILEGILVLPSNSPSPVTIDSVQLQIHEGNTASGLPWFGPSEINYTEAEGYPVQVVPGGSWAVDWAFENFDNHYHNITAVYPQSPFTLASTTPPLPYQVGPDADQCTLTISVQAPSTPGTTYDLVTVVVYAGTVS